MNGKHFPNLNSANYLVTSPETSEYNCIAWAAGENDVWWWPHPNYYWPNGVPMECNLEAFKKAYETLSYAECADGKYEPEYEKVAIYIDRDGKPTHAARQLSSGRWTSKLGQNVDINHETIEALEGQVYGTVALFMKRRIK